MQPNWELLWKQLRDTHIHDIKVEEEDIIHVSDLQRLMDELELDARQ
jgi:hypothetical protein